MLVRTTTITAVVVAASLALAGCSSDAAESDPTATQAPPAATQAPAPSPTPSDPATDNDIANDSEIEAAAQQYIDFTAPVNAFMDQSRDIETWEEDTVIASDYAAHLETFQSELESAEWPESIAPYVDAVVTEVADEIAYVQGMAEAADEDAYWEARNSSEIGERTAAQALRIQLGIESPNTDG